MNVFLASPWVPAEWIRAHGLAPRGMWCAEGLHFDSAGLSAGVCAFAQEIVRRVETDPEAALVFTTHCDQLRRGFDVAASVHSGRCFLFNLPATWESPVGERMYVAELRRLGDFLVRLGGHSPRVGDLAVEMARESQARRCLLELVGKGSARSFAEAVARFHWTGGSGEIGLAESVVERPGSGDGEGAGSGQGGERGVRLALVGGPLPRSHWRLLEAVDAAGGRVVLYAAEPGERSLWLTTEPVPAGDGSELLSFLARQYLTHCVDVFRRPNTRLYEWLGQRLAARRVQGLLLWHYVGCDLWRAEAQSMREAFGLPLLVLEADAIMGGWQRTIGRIDAFLEALAT